MNIDYAELERRASAALLELDGCDWDLPWAIDSPGEPGFEFILAASPAMVLELLRRIRSAEIALTLIEDAAEREGEGAFRAIRDWSTGALDAMSPCSSEEKDD